MRIGMITQWYDPELGPARLPGSLARSLVSRGHEVKVLTGFPNYPTGKVMDGYKQSWSYVENVGGVEVHRVPLYPNHSASVAGRIANYASFAATAYARSLKALGACDALWVSNSPTTVALPLWRIAAKTNIPTMLHILDLWPDNVLSSGLVKSASAEKVLVNLINSWNKKLYESVDHVGCISPGVLELLQQRGVPREKMTYIPMWATNEAEINSYRRLQDHRELHTSGEAITILYAGNVGSTQTVESLVRASDFYPDSAPSVVVNVVGSGTEWEKVERLAASRNKPNFRINLVGRVSEEALREFMLSGDIHYVGLLDDQNSRVSIPSKVQSTLAWGKPLLVSMNGDTANIVSRASAGIIAKPEDPQSIAEAISSAAGLGKAGLAQLGQNGRSLYDREFSLDIATKRVEEVLQQLVAR